MNRKLSPAGTLALLTGLNLFNYLDRYIVAAVLVPIQKDLAINDAAAGRINTAFMLGYFLTAPFFGFLGDRASRRWLIALGIFVWSVGTMLTGFASGFAMLLCFRVLVGVGEASYATISPSVLSDSFGPARRNNALTIFYVAIPVGAALGYVLGGEVAAHFGWRRAFLWAGLPGLLLALALLPFREPDRGQAEGGGAAPGARPRLADVFGILRLADFHLIVWGYVAYTFALGAFGFWGPNYLHRIHGVANEHAASFFGIVTAIAGLVGTFAGGFAATAWRKRNPAAYAFTLGLATLAAAPVAVIAFVTTNTPLSMGCLALAMLLLFLPTGPVNTLILETVPANLRSSAMAISIFMIHLFGDLRSSEIVGRLSDHWGSLQKAVLILPGALLVGGLLWLALAFKTRRACRQPPVNESARTSG